MSARHTLSTFPIVMNQPRKGLPWYRVLQMFINIFLFLAIAAISIPICLGYRINWLSGTITQTGLIELDGPQERLALQVYINSQLQTGGFPFRQNWVFPGEYTVVVQRSGYQSWTKTIEVDANKRSTYDTIVLIYNQPQEIPAPSDITLSDLQTKAEGSDSIQIEDENELFVNKTYYTSTSQNIVSARWYVDRDHVVYQTGNQLVLYDLSSETTMSLATFTTKEPVPYIFEDGGRILIYDDGSGIKAFTLYEPLSFIDRWGVGQ